MNAAIDRAGRLPIYHQVALNIQQRIANHEWEVGARLPNEYELAEHYGVSRVTVRQALSELEKDGLVVRRRPSGTFVARLPEKLTPNISVMVNILQSLNELGHSSDIETLSVRKVDVASAEIKGLLGVASDEQFTQYRRRVTVDETPFAWVETLVPQSLCPGLHALPLIDNSIQRTLDQHFGVRVSRAEHWIEALRPSEEDLEVLGSTPDRLILDMTSVYSDANDRPVAHMTTHWLADLMRLHLRSTTSDALLASH